MTGRSTTRSTALLLLLALFVSLAPAFACASCAAGFDERLDAPAHRIPVSRVAPSRGQRLVRETRPALRATLQAVPPTADRGGAVFGESSLTTRRTALPSPPNLVDVPAPRAPASRVL
jgi:hypothetical protein